MKNEELKKLNPEDLLQEAYRLNGQLENVTKINDMTLERLIKEKKTLSEENSELQIKANFADRMIAKQKERVVKALVEEKTALKNTKIMLFKGETIIAKQTLIAEYIQKYTIKIGFILILGLMLLAITNDIIYF